MEKLFKIEPIPETNGVQFLRKDDADEFFISTTGPMLLSSTNGMEIRRSRVSRKGLSSAGQKKRLKPFVLEFVNVSNQPEEEYVYASVKVQQLIAKKFQAALLSPNISQRSYRIENSLSVVADELSYLHCHRESILAWLRESLLEELRRGFLQWRRVAFVKWTDDLTITFWRFLRERNCDKSLAFILGLRTICSISRRCRRNNNSEEEEEEEEVLHLSVDAFDDLELAYASAFLGKNCVFITDNCPERGFPFFIARGFRIAQEHQYLLPSIVRYSLLPPGRTIELVHRAVSYMQAADFLSWEVEDARLKKLLGEKNEEEEDEENEIVLVFQTSS
jgi:hypothetical protein